MVPLVPEQPVERRRGSVERTRAAVTNLIAEQGLRAGDRIPTEPELATLLGVGRSTLREALKGLEQQGLVVAVQGHGRYVSGSGSLAVERPITQYEGIGELLTNLGYAVTTTVLDVSEATADPTEATALQVRAGHPVIRLTRLRFGNGEPLVYSRNVILREALPGPIAHRDWSRSIGAALEAHGQGIVSSSARITASDLPPGVARSHALSGLGPWLLVTETCITRAGDRVLLSADYHRGGLIGFNVLRRR